MTLFLLLGLLVFPSDLTGVAPEGLALVAVLVLVARPLATFVVLPWFRIGRGTTAFVAWAGLRGAVPIVLATFPLRKGPGGGCSGHVRVRYTIRKGKFTEWRQLEEPEGAPA